MGSIIASYHSDLQNWGSPNASLNSDGKVAVTITGHNEYEDDGGLWPPGSDAPPPFEYALRSQVGAPPPMRDTATSLGCRLVSQSKIASLLGAQADEPLDFCSSANAKAWTWAQSTSPARVVSRYHSKQPCNGCAAGVPVLLKKDHLVGPEFINSTLLYNLTTTSLSIQSTAFVTAAEHSCTLFSPARALDVLYLDAYGASIYPDSAREDYSIVI